MDLQLTGKTALITGASKGIGLAAAHAFAREGCHLHLTARSGDALKAIKDEITAEHDVNVHLHVLDLCVSDNLVTLAHKAAGCDILINNAGDVPSGPIESLTEADWRLFTTLVRFDSVYHLHFKCNRRRIVDYPNLWAYTRALYQHPGVAGTVRMDHIVRHYHYSHDTINPNRIIPINPLLDFLAPHGR